MWRAKFRWSKLYKTQMKGGIEKGPFEGNEHYNIRPNCAVSQNTTGINVDYILG